MGKQIYNKNLKENEKKKGKKKTQVIILITFLLLATLGYKYYVLYKENFDLKEKLNNYEQNETLCTKDKEVSSFISIGIKTFMQDQQYNLFKKLLLFLGFIYLIQIGISAAVDITELIAFAFISLRGLFRLPKRIKGYFGKKRENDEK